MKSQQTADNLLDVFVAWEAMVNMQIEIYCNPMYQRWVNALVIGLGLSLASLGLVGCDRGPKLVKAEGELTYQGKPVSDADVVFVPDAGGAPVIGRTDQDGSFILTTDGRPGAYVGSYKVAVTAVRQKRKVDEAEAVAMTSAQIAANHESMIPIKYNNTISSGLTAQVSEDPAANRIELQLK